MKSREQLLREWSRSLVATVLAVLIVAAIVGAAIQAMSSRDGGNRFIAVPGSSPISKTKGGQALPSTDRSRRLAATTGPNAIAHRESRVGETTGTARNTSPLRKKELSRSAGPAAPTTESDPIPESPRLAIDAGSDAGPQDDSTERASKPTPGNSRAMPDGPGRQPKLTVAERKRADGAGKKRSATFTNVCMPEGLKPPETR